MNQRGQWSRPPAAIVGSQELPQMIQAPDRLRFADGGVGQGFQKGRPIATRNLPAVDQQEPTCSQMGKLTSCRLPCQFVDQRGLADTTVTNQQDVASGAIQAAGELLQCRFGKPSADQLTRVVQCGEIQHRKPLCGTA